MAPAFGVAMVTYAPHFAVLEQFLLSLAANVKDLRRCSFLVVTSDTGEADALRLQLRLDGSGQNSSLTRSVEPSSPSSLSRLSLHIIGFGSAVCTVSAPLAWARCTCSLSSCAQRTCEHTCMCPLLHAHIHRHVHVCMCTSARAYMLMCMKCMCTRTTVCTRYRCGQ